MFSHHQIYTWELLAVGLHGYILISVSATMDYFGDPQILDTNKTKISGRIWEQKLWETLFGELPLQQSPR